MRLILWWFSAKKTNKVDPCESKRPNGKLHFDDLERPQAIISF